MKLLICSYDMQHHANMLGNFTRSPQYALMGYVILFVAGKKSS